MLACVLLSLPVQTQAQQAMQKIRNFMGNILSYKDNYPQEKVYLHLDNNGYFPGETIWFKAYVFKASTLLPTDVSKVLYVELLNPLGEMVERKILPVENGRTFGEFELDPIRCYSGFYEVRAYTRAMLNWDDAYIYSRVLPVFQMPKHISDISSLKVADVRYDRKLPMNRKEPAPLLAPNSQKDNGVVATFYPEGGNIVSGIASRVAFKVTDKNGNPISAVVKACAPDGSEICSAATVHEGMGLLSLPADWQGGYAVVQKQDDKSAKIKLPEALAEGCVMQTEMGADGLDISVMASGKYKNSLLGVSVVCRSAACYFDTLMVRDDGAVHRVVPTKQLKDGVQQVTLFTPEGEVLAERLVWSEPKQEQPHIVVRQNQTVYEPCTPVVLDITLSDAEGKPLQSDFSISVKDADSEVAANGADLAVDMLLSSELKGYIHNPGYYFASADAEHRQALDLLLMVQGWRRYKWREMAGLDPLAITQPAEQNLLLDGKAILPSDGKKFTARDLDITFLMTQNGLPRTLSVKPENTGEFGLNLPDIYGDVPAAVVTTVRDKNKDVPLVFNRNFSPRPKNFEPLALLLEPYAEEQEKTETEAVVAPVKTFEWKDTIQVHRRVTGDINLQEVTIHGKRDPEIGARFAWNGGLNASLRTARHYYDVSTELDRYCDNGQQTPNLWDWLAERDPDFYFDLSFYDEQELMQAKMLAENNKFTDEVIALITNLKFNSQREKDEARKDFEEGRKKVLDDKSLRMLALMKTMRYKGKPALVLQDNAGPLDDVTTLHLDDVKSIVTSEDEDFIRLVVPERLFTEGYLQPPYSAVFIYTNPKGPAPYSKGMRKMNIHGYSYCQDFYSPDYRGADYPDPEDYRRTLYWNPSLTTDTHGKANIILYSNARPDMRLDVDVQGIAVNGQMFGTK